MPNTPNYSTTVLLCSVLALLTMPVHAGFMLIFLAPVFAIWVPYSFVLMWRSPASRRIQMNKLMIWTVVICSIVSLHWFYAYSARKNAEEIVSQIIQFKEANRHYPKTLNEIGYSAEQLKQKLGISGYNFDSNQLPKLYYAVTYIPFDTYSYDFQNNSWTHHSS